MARLDQFYKDLSFSLGGDSNQPQFSLNLIDLNRENNWQYPQNFRTLANQQYLPLVGFGDSNPYAFDRGSPRMHFGITFGDNDCAQNHRFNPNYQFMPQVVLVDNNRFVNDGAYRHDTNFAFNPFKSEHRHPGFERLTKYELTSLNFVENKHIAVGNGRLTESVPTRPGSCEHQVESFESGDKPSVKFQRLETSQEALEQRLGRKLKQGECAWTVTNGGGDRSNGFNDKTFIGKITYDEKRHGVMIDVEYPVKHRILYKDNGSVVHQFPHQEPYIYKPKTSHQNPYEIIPGDANHEHISKHGTRNDVPESYSGVPRRSNSIAADVSVTYSEPSLPNSHAWRAGYGVSGSIVPTLQEQNEQVRYDVQNLTSERRWKANPNNIRSWNDPFDDPAINQEISKLRQNGLANVSGRQNA